MKTEKKNDIWYLAFPTSLYVEDVKALAKRAGVRIVDAAHAAPDRPYEAESVPKVTLVAHAKGKKAATQTPGKEPTAEEVAAAEALKNLTGPGA